MAGFGAFGKMPALGDFFRVGVAPGFVDPWDRWLQGGIVAARTALGDRWQECFFSAPIWRFTLGAGLAGPDPVLGVLMASVDRVGRQFPLTLVAPLPGRADVLATHFAAAECFNALEAVALDALDDAMTREALTDRLQGVAPVAVPGQGRVARSGGALVLAAPDPVPALAAHLAGAGYRSPSVWSAVLDGATRAMVLEGLPSPSQIAAFYDLEAPLWQAVLTEGEPA